MHNLIAELKKYFCTWLRSASLTKLLGILTWFTHQSVFNHLCDKYSDNNNLPTNLLNFAIGPTRLAKTIILFILLFVVFTWLRIIVARCNSCKSVCLWCNWSVDQSILVDPLGYFPFQPVLCNWCNRSVFGMVHIQDPLQLIRKSSLWNGDSVFPIITWMVLYYVSPISP